jgi:hypothetical protein
VSVLQLGKEKSAQCDGKGSAWAARRPAVGAEERVGGAWLGDWLVGGRYGCGCGCRCGYERVVVVRVRLEIGSHVLGLADEFLLYIFFHVMCLSLPDVHIRELADSRYLSTYLPTSSEHTAAGPQQHYLVPCDLGTQKSSCLPPHTKTTRRAPSHTAISFGARVLSIRVVSASTMGSTGRPSNQSSSVTCSSHGKKKAGHLHQHHYAGKTTEQSSQHME